MNVMSAILWKMPVRVGLFWGLFAVILYGLDVKSQRLDFGLIASRMARGVALLGGGGNSERDLALLSELDFIFALTYAIGAVALALALCFLLFHVTAIVVSLGLSRRKFTRLDGLEGFAREYDQTVYDGLARNRLIGHAWREFDETLVKPGPGEQMVIRNTVRPQSFINVGVARDRLFGLKMMAGIPGYFVAVGLLLTFMGIVLALYKAGAASSAKDVVVMQGAMTDLLQIASFKFATSIAGLGCSLLLSIVFKVYTIWIEGSFNDFCQAAERKLKYVPPQSLAIEMNEAVKEQRDQLKEINSDKFFAQMGRQLEPQIQQAFATAMNPINTSISAALDRISETSQSGVSDMLHQFTTSVQGSAGTELRELAETLKAMQVTLAETQSGVRGSGEDFARRMSEAAENLSRLVGDAARTFDSGATQNRESLSEIMSAMKATFENANSQIEAQLGGAAGAASGRIEEAMGRVLDKLEGQVGTVAGSLTAFDTNLRDGLAQTQEQIRASQQGAVETISAVATSSAQSMGRVLEQLEGQMSNVFGNLNSFDASLKQGLAETQHQITSAQQGAAQTIAAIAQASAEAIRDGLADAIAAVRSEVDRLQSALRTSGTALASQASAIGDATSQTRQVSDAFAKTANDVRVAASPLIQSGEKIATATASFETSLKSAVTALNEGHQTSGELSDSLKMQGESMVAQWREYEQRFARIDEALAKAVSDLAGATEKQGETLSRYTTDIDQGLAKAVDKLLSSLSDIQESIEGFSDEVQKLGTQFRSAAE